MADLIERDAVAYKLKSCIIIPADSEWDSGYNTAMAEAKQYIQNAPAVNRWISVEDALPEQEVSEDAREKRVDRQTDYLYTEVYDGERVCYCGSCGAVNRIDAVHCKCCGAEFIEIVEV